MKIMIFDLHFAIWAAKKYCNTKSKIIMLKKTSEKHALSIFFARPLFFLRGEKKKKKNVFSFDSPSLTEEGDSEHSTKKKKKRT